MLEKASLLVDRGSAGSETIPVMYNPTELSDNRTVKVCGVGNNVQFERLIRDDMTLSLFFDTYEAGTDVRDKTRQIQSLMIRNAGKGTRKEPPKVSLSWAGVWFTGIVIGLKQNFTMFLPSGVPVRARLEVTLKSILTDKEELAALGIPNCRKLHLVTSNDRIDLMAYETTGDPAWWREIAEANDIADPLAFPLTSQTGNLVVIPDYHQSGQG